MQAKNIKKLSFGCRLNTLEAEKIQLMLASVFDAAIIVNTCAVTAEAERQSAQAIRRLSRENPNAPIFVTGCAATRNPGIFTEIPNTVIVDNKDKMNLDAYTNALAAAPCHQIKPEIQKFNYKDSKLSKQFIQIQNGCNHRCSYCVTRLLRGKNVSFPYETVLHEVQNAVRDGFYEIVLTGVDIASFYIENMRISDLCHRLLADVPEIQRLRLSSMDPASPEITKLLELMKRDRRMMPHMHLSMQSGSDTILAAMLRRHNADTVRQFVPGNNDNFTVSFSWDIICGFPGETPELFIETCDLVRELGPIKIHAFPFSARPGTAAADLPNHINKSESKQRVKIISELADENKRAFMKSQVGNIVTVLVEEKNIARTPDDIEVHLTGDSVPARTVCAVQLVDISDLHFVGKIC